MTYKEEDIFEISKKVIYDYNLIFISDIIAYLPCERSTFYTLFPDGSDKLDTLKSLLHENKVTLKVAMRKKWFESDNATLQMALMKLLSTGKELKQLSMQHIDHTSKGNEMKAPIIMLSNTDDDE